MFRASFRTVVTMLMSTGAAKGRDRYHSFGRGTAD